MARWITYKRTDGTLGVLRQGVDGQAQPCGIVRADTPDSMIIDWVIENGIQVGDLIQLENGRELLALRHGGIA